MTARASQQPAHSEPTGNPGCRGPASQPGTMGLCWRAPGLAQSPGTRGLFGSAQGLVSLAEIALPRAMATHRGTLNRGCTHGGPSLGGVSERRAAAVVPGAQFLGLAGGEERGGKVGMGVMVPGGAGGQGSSAGLHVSQAARGSYRRVDVSVFMPRRRARLDACTGCSRGACGLLLRAR